MIINCSGPQPGGNSGGGGMGNFQKYKTLGEFRWTCQKGEPTPYINEFNLKKGPFPVLMYVYSLKSENKTINYD